MNQNNVAVQQKASYCKPCKPGFRLSRSGSTCLGGVNLQQAVAQYLSASVGAACPWGKNSVTPQPCPTPGW